MITMASKLLSTDQQNFVRLGIGCVDLIKLALKDILGIQIQPKDLYTAIKSCAELSTGRYQLRPEQKKLCFLPPPFIPDYDKFDVSLLYTLIRNLCPSYKPTQGWGKTPATTDIQIGDDIERLRLFRNEMFAHLKSTAVPDTEFTPQWKDLETIIQRIQAFVISKGYSANYEKELGNTAKSDFGFEDMQKYKILLEGMMHLLKQTENEDIPRISINGEDKVLCGKMALFEAKVENPSKSPSCSIIWQRVRKNVTEQIDTSLEKYKGSTNRRLIINAVSKEDKGEYRAVISWERDGQTHNTTSNSIFLNARGEQPNLKKLSVTTGTEGVSLHYEYEVLQGSPKVHDIRWTRNGKILNIDQKKFAGGGLMNRYLTITSPTAEDRGTYICTVTNAVAEVSESLVLDLPNAKISTEESVCFGNETRIDAKITSCPGCEGVVWQKSSDSATFTTIDVGEPKHYGSKLDPDNPVLVLTRATFQDKLFYRLLVWNKIGECSSNTVSINVTGGTPNISSSHETNIKDRSVTLICEVFLYENSPSLKEIEWMKNDAVIDIAGSKGKYTGGNIRDASLVIKDVNKYDSGSYQCKASNAVGSTTGCKIVLDVPEIHVERPEKTKNDTLVFTAYLKSIPAVIHAQWSKKNKEDDTFVPVDITSEEYIGTSNAIPNPVLEIRQKIDINKHIFQIEVWNFIGTSAKIIQDNSSFPNDATAEPEDDILTSIFNMKGSSIRFNNLRLDLIREIPDRELNSLKESLKVTAKKLTTENIASIEGFLAFLLEKGIFKERNVIMMQYLMRSIKRPDLELKCVEYAMKDKHALCYFEETELPEDGNKHVQLHVVDDIEQFTNMDALLATVAAIVGCDQSCIKVVGLHPESSFIITISMKEEFARTLRQKGPYGLVRLLKYNVDWIKVENEIIYIAEGSKMELRDREKMEGYLEKIESFEEKLRGSITDSGECKMHLQEKKMVESRLKERAKQLLTVSRMNYGEYEMEFGKKEKMEDQTKKRESREGKLKEKVVRSRFAKLWIATHDVLIQAYRDILELEISSSDIENNVKSSQKKIHLNPAQEDLLRKAKYSGYENFDFSLTYMLIRYICSTIPKPTKGKWGGNSMPLAGEVTVGDDIERIRLIRNNLAAHVSSASTLQTEFDKTWSMMSDICQRLEAFTGKKYLDKLNYIQTLSLKEEDKDVIIEKVKMESHEIEKRKKRNLAAAMASAKPVAFGKDLGGRSKFAKLGMATNEVLNQAYRDILELEVAPSIVYTKVKASLIYETLRPEQERLLLDAKYSGYKNFDFSLTYTLIRNICSTIPKPTKGKWGGNSMPSAGEMTVGDDIERIRLIRNSLTAHVSSASIPQTEFADTWSLISDICQRLEIFTGKKYLDKLNHIQKLTLKEEDEDAIIEKNEMENQHEIDQAIISLSYEFETAMENT